MGERACREKYRGGASLKTGQAPTPRACGRLTGFELSKLISRRCSVEVVPRITVVGSYATGLTMKVKRLPSRGETLLGTGYRVDFGGKGSNQAVGCARLGAKVSFVAKIGNDSLGNMALDLYRSEGIDVTHVRQIADVPTGVGFIVVEADSGNNCIVLDPGANELLSADDVDGCEGAFDSAADRARAASRFRWRRLKRRFCVDALRVR